MTDWFVREDATHLPGADPVAAGRDGTTWATAWGGWSEIIWRFAGSPAAGDTIYICGAHSYSATIAPGLNNSATGAANHLFIRSDAVTNGGYTNGVDGEDGSITMTAGYIQHNRDYIELVNLTAHQSHASTRLIGIERGAGDASEQYVIDCTLSSDSTSAAMVEMIPVTGSFSDIRIQGNSFTDGYDGVLISSNTAGLTPAISDLQITDNVFTNQSHRGLSIFFGENMHADAQLDRLTVTGNTFTDSGYISAYIFLGGGQISTRTGGRGGTDLIFENNTSVDAGNGAGDGGEDHGAFVIGSFDNTDNEYSQTNRIINNTTTGTRGSHGGLNIFNMKYCRIYGNTCDDATSTSNDGNGILLDWDNEYCDVYNNYCGNNTGVPALDPTVNPNGCGLMILRSTNLTVHHNIFAGNKVGCLSSAVAADSNVIANNAFLSCEEYGVLNLNTFAGETLTFKNNIVTGDGTGQEWYGDTTAGVEADEDYNAFYNFDVGFTDQTQGSNDLDTDPGWTVEGLPHARTMETDTRDAGVLIAGVTDQTDYYGNSRITADIGPMWYLSATPLSLGLTSIKDSITASLQAGDEALIALYDVARYLSALDGVTEEINLDDYSPGVYKDTVDARPKFTSATTGTTTEGADPTFVVECNDSAATMSIAEDLSGLFSLLDNGDGTADLTFTSGAAPAWREGGYPAVVRATNSRGRADHRVRIRVSP